METEEFLRNYDEEHGLSSPEREPSSKKWLVWLLGALLLGSLGYNFYQHKNNSDFATALEDSGDKVINLSTEKASLQAELNQLTADYEESRKNLTEKDEVLTQKDEEIASKQKEIQNILNKNKTSEKDLSEAKKMIASLNTQIAGYKKDIAALTAKNDSLFAINEELKINESQLAEALESEKVTSQIERERSEAMDHKMKSTFSVSNFNISGIKVRKSGKEVEKDKATRVDKLRVTFDLDPNPHAEDGDKELFVAIFKPDGTLGKFDNATSGTISTNVGEVQYSDKVTIPYKKGSKQNITFDWEDYNFDKGMYAIDVYQNGMKIGQKSIELK